MPTQGKTFLIGVLLIALVVPLSVKKTGMSLQGLFRTSSSLDKQKRLKKADRQDSIRIPASDHPSKSTSDKSVGNVLSLVERKEIGEQWEYKGFTLMRISGIGVLTNDEVRVIEDEWDDRVADFILNDFKKGEPTYQRYLQAKRSSFLTYDSTARPIEGEIREKFGTEVQLIRGKELNQLYEASWKSYRDRLREILGSEGYTRFEKLQDHYGEWVYQKFNVGWTDLR